MDTIKHKIYKINNWIKIIRMDCCFGGDRRKPGVTGP